MSSMDVHCIVTAVSSEVKRPLLPPTSKVPAEKSKPLPLPPGLSRLLSHHENEEDGSNVGQSVSKWDGQQPNIHESPAENANSARSGPPSPGPSPSVMETPATSGSHSHEDAKQIARMQVCRAIEQAKTTSSGPSDGKNEPLPSKSHSLSPPPLPAAGTDSRKSRTSSMTSPLPPTSPLSTPSPTVLVSFGLASQAKRRRDRQQEGQILEVDDDEYDGSGHLPGVSRPGQFAGASKSIVSAATKRFEKQSEQHERQNLTKKKVQSVSDMDRVQNTHSPPQRNGEKEVLSCEGHEVFSSQEQQEPGKTALTKSKQQFPRRNLKSESQAVSDSTRRGVTCKRGVLRADESWIRSRNDSEAEDVEDSRSHQILNTSSPTPPSQPPTSGLPRTFNATPQHALPGSTIPTKPASRKVQSHGRTTAHHLASQFEGNVRSRVRVSPIAESEISRENRTKSGMSRSASDDSIQGTLQRRDILYSSQRQVRPTTCTCT